MTTHELNGFDVPLAKSLLFGVLVDYAIPTLEHFRSDLYHDVKWIEANVPTELGEGERYTFYWGLDSWGTCIGEEPSLQTRDIRYKVTVYCERGRWKVDMESLSVA